MRESACDCEIGISEDLRVVPPVDLPAGNDSAWSGWVQPIATLEFQDDAACTDF